MVKAPETVTRLPRRRPSDARELATGECESSFTRLVSRGAPRLMLASALCWCGQACSGGALALDHLERSTRLEGRLDQQTRARGERAADRHRDAGGPEERIGGVDAVVGREPHEVGEAVRLEHRRALRVQHTLRLRGGTRV